jgi:protocatechuate 3,4-dioxygenase beta subunit
MVFQRLVPVLAAVLSMVVALDAQRERGLPDIQRRDAGTPARDAPRGTAVIRGMVLAADTGMPIRRAQVRATSSSSRESRLTITDAQGRFELKELPAGRYTLHASKGGFVPLQYGQRRPSEAGTPLDIADRQVMDKVVIALPRGSVISGRVFDEFGEPVANAVVTAMRYGYTDGVRRLMPAAGQNSRGTTDDQGAFRLFGLPPGEYIVSASFRGTGREITDPIDEPAGYAPTYFPGTPNPGEAQRVHVDVGQEQSGINFALIATRLVRVAGTVMDSRGAPVTGGFVSLMTGDRTQVRMPFAGNGARVDRTGAFRISNVAPGRYILQARTSGNTREMARMDLSVGFDNIDNVVVLTRPGGTASGEVITDTGERPAIAPGSLAVAVQPASPEPGVGAPNARVSERWTFELRNLFGPTFLRVNAPSGWTLKQVLLDGRDVTDTPIDFSEGQSIGGIQIVLSRRVSLVAGTITDSRGQPATDATVVVFPADERLWYFRSRFIRAARPDQQGRYEIRALPAYDDYLIAVVQALEDGQAGDPEFLAAIRSNATRLALNDGETKTADVKLAAAR